MASLGVRSPRTKIYILEVAKFKLIEACLFEDVNIRLAPQKFPNGFLNFGCGVIVPLLSERYSFLVWC